MPRAAAFVAALASAVLWVALSGGPAFAHAGIVKASPEYDETVSRPPEEVRITFNESVQAEFDPIKVYGPGGERVDRNDARTDPDDPATMVASLERDLPAGSYRVEWRATSADGHPIDGKYNFVAKQGAAGAGANSARADNARSGDDPGAAGERSEPPSGGGFGRIAAYGALGAGVVAVAVVVLLSRRKT